MNHPYLGITVIHIYFSLQGEFPYTYRWEQSMNFNDIMVIATGVLCFLVGVLLVPMIGSYFYSSSGFYLPMAVTGVIDLVLILILIWVHTRIVLYNQKRKIKRGSDLINAAFRADSETGQQE